MVGLGIFIALITCIVRRRRARRFDRELDEATAEANKASAPAFLEDDTDYDPVPRGRGYGGGGVARGLGAGSAAGYGGGAAGGVYNNQGGSDYGYAGPQMSTATGYSDASSHGTYRQPPMSTSSHYAPSQSNITGDSTFASPPGIVAPMREVTRSPGPAVGEIYDPIMHGPYASVNNMVGAPPSAGAAGIGVLRARSMRADGQISYASVLNEGNSPYAAFIAPGMPGHANGNSNGNGTPQNQRISSVPGMQRTAIPSGYRVAGTSDYHLLEAAGIGMPPSMPVPTHAPSGQQGQSTLQSGSSQGDLERSLSSATHQTHRTNNSHNSHSSQHTGSHNSYLANAPQSENYYQPGFAPVPEDDGPVAAGLGTKRWSRQGSPPQPQPPSPTRQPHQYQQQRRRDSDLQDAYGGIGNAMLSDDDGKSQRSENQKGQAPYTSNPFGGGETDRDSVSVYSDMESEQDRRVLKVGIFI